MRDYLLLAVFVLCLFYSIRNPFVGVMVFFWISFMNPHRYAWGFAHDFSFAQIAALVAFVSAFLNFKQLQFPNTRETYLFLLFWIFITLTTVFSFYPDSAWQKWTLVSKIFLMTLLAMMVVTSPRKLLIFTLVITLSIGFRGVTGAVFGVETGGQYKVWGPEESFIADNNDIGLAFVMIIPLCFIGKDIFAKRWQRHFLLGVGIASAISTVLTYSRGALLGLATVLILTIFTSTRKRVMLSIVAVLVFLGSFLLPAQWYERMKTIETYESDLSANQRLNSWRFSYNLACSNLLGGGFDCFELEQYQIYAPHPEMAGVLASDGTRVGATAHSSYFQVIATQGFAGFGIYMLCLMSMLSSLRRVRRVARVLRHGTRIASYSMAFSVSIIGFMVGSAFLSRAFFDLFWAIYAAGICLINIVYSWEWVEDTNCGSGQGAFVEHQGRVLA